jgi:excinuclease ABC subunit C
MKKFKFLTKNKISQLPKTSGVYCFKKGQEILYIGKAANIRERVNQHVNQHRKLISQATKVGYIKTGSEFAEPSAHLTSHPASQGSTIEALILEANLIKKYQPKYNVVWRDDKNYFYVGLTKEDFPRIFLTHRLTLDMRCPKYVGPFVDGKALKQTLKVLRKVFPYRTCKTLPKRPCLWHQLARCPAPCLLRNQKYGGRTLILLKRRVKSECQRNVKNLLRILQGKKSQVLKNLKKEMKKLSKEESFEKAIKIRDQIKSLEKVMFHTKIFDLVEVQPRQIGKWRKIQKILQKILKTKEEISRIEAYDISNIQGKEATGSMVTFVDGLPSKNFYRRFKIKIAGKPDDIAMIKEVLSRRFKHLEWGLPDLILIDGGKAQLNVALQIKNEKCKMKNYNLKFKIISLAKKENKLFIENRKKPILLKGLPREIFNLILQLRDKAHRFAISYHKKLRKKILLEN